MIRNNKFFSKVMYATGFTVVIILIAFLCLKGEEISLLLYDFLGVVVKAIPFAVAFVCAFAFGYFCYAITANKVINNLSRKLDSANGKIHKQRKHIARLTHELNQKNELVANLERELEEYRRKEYSASLNRLNDLIFLADEENNDTVNSDLQDSAED